MNKSKSTPWIVAGIVVIGAGVVIYSMKKKASKNTDMPSPSLNTGSTPAPTTNNNPSPTSTSVIGKNAYVGKSGLIVRSSPELSDGFLGFGSNNVGAVNKVDTLLGIVQGTETDKDMDRNPMTGQPYVWYLIKKNPSLKLLAADNYYVREDYTTLK